MDFSVQGILVNLLFSTIGWLVFRKGRKDAETKLIVIGMLLMGYPYFVEGPKLLWGIGLALSGWAYYEIKGKYS